MSAEYDGEVGEAADEPSFPFWNCCLLCGTNLEQDWPDLSGLSPSDIKNHAHDEWRRAAKSGCPFCSIIISIIDDAGEHHGCSIPDDYELANTGSPAGDETRGFQVILSRNESTGRYLLALELVWMPLEEPRAQSEFWGTITVYLDEPDAFNLNLEPFFEIPRHSDSAEGLRYARDWLTTCRNNHPDCCLDSERDEDLSDFPGASIRMLQICDGKLILTPVELCGALPPYVALSHCWGLFPTLKTLSSNIEKFRNGIGIQDLPSTFNDAVKMTKMLGFDYIWIDSLCIIQDSSIDWEEQSSLMGFVYGKADLVLAVSSASSTGEGFLKERKGYRESSLRLSSVRNKENTLALRYRLLQPKKMPPMLDPVDCRAWALQERLLARRYLAIGSHDTTWTCMTSSACECEWWRVASIWRDEIVNVKKLVQEATDEDLGHLWRRRVLRNYFTRELTVPSDNLVALSAIVSVFQKKSRSKYCAGIWQGDMIPGLLWDYLFRNSGYALDDSAPSWSWASLPTLDIGEHMAICESPQSEAQARVLDASTVPSTLNPFGSVCSGFIKLWGPLWRVEVTTGELVSASGMLKVKGYEENYFMIFFDTSLRIVELSFPDGAEERSLRRVRREEVQDNFYVGIGSESDKVSLFMVPLMKECISSERHYTRGLALGRSPKEPTKFERLGVFFTPDIVAIDDEDGTEICEEQEIVII